jgi:hypothetical protein
MYLLTSILLRVQMKNKIEMAWSLLQSDISFGYMDKCTSEQWSAAGFKLFKPILHQNKLIFPVNAKTIRPYNVSVR